VLAHPFVAAGIVLLLVLLAVWLLPKLFRFIVRLLRRLAGASSTADQAR
jgi:flagellar biogenesis protein FliO